MGGSSKNTTPAPAAASSTPTQPMQTVQPAMPGQLETLAQQLGAGFGQSPADMMSYLQQFYKPMQVPDYGATPAVAPAPTPAPATPGPTKFGAGKKRTTNNFPLPAYRINQD